MKNFKNTILVTSAALVAGFLASLLSGCDGISGAEWEGEADAGRSDSVVAGDVGRSDVVRAEVTASGDARVTPCTVPEPKFSLGGLVTTTPRRGYVVVESEDVACKTMQYAVKPPTNCSDPVDGFSGGVNLPWCYLVLSKTGDRYYLKSPSLDCSVTGAEVASAGLTSTPFGDVAACSPGGKFLGWASGG